MSDGDNNDNGAGPSRLPMEQAPAPAGAAGAPIASSSQATSSSSSAYRPLKNFSFPLAAQPEIVRAYQKDAYYRDLFVDQLKDVVRSVLGVRVLHNHSEMVAVLGGAAYFALSALNGAQTLGEEYVNAMMVDGKTGRISRGKRRAVFIFSQALLPYLVAKTYASFRRFLVRSDQARKQAYERARLRALAMLPVAQRKQGVPASALPKQTLVDRITATLAERLPSMESFTASDSWLAYFGAAHLALFYLTGRYYSVAQRVAKVRYISTISRRPGQEPSSYEVLGVLLGFQILVKMLLGLNRWRRERSKLLEERKAAARAASGAPLTAEEEEQRRLRAEKEERETVVIDGVRWSHKSSPATLVDGPPADAGGADADEVLKHAPPGSAIAPLAYADPDSAPLSAEALGLPEGASPRDIETAQAAARGRAMELENIAQSVLRCTLCMEQRTPEKGGSAVTECGHVFCWDCISGWAREKPECPLCRQSISPHRLLPVYNF